MTSPREPVSHTHPAPWLDLGPLPRGAVVVCRTVEAAVLDLWPVLGDSDRIDRVLGLPAVVHRVETNSDGLPVRVAHARTGGLAFTWQEPPYEWCAPHLLRGGREFLRGPVAEGGMQVSLRPEGERRTQVHLAVWGTPASRWLRLLSPLLAAGTRRRLLRLLDEIADAARSGREALETHGRRLRALGDAPRIDRVELMRRADAARTLGADEDILKALAEAVATWPTVEVASLRPGDVGARSGQPFRKVLDAMLTATAAGLLDLRWQVDCPVCRVAAAYAEDLGDVGTSVHCDVCQVTYDVDFGDHVEAVFRPHPAVRPVDAHVRCASSPAFRPHVRAQVVVRPDRPRRLLLPTTAECVVVRTLQRPRRVEIRLDEPARVRVRVAPGEVEAVLRKAPPSGAFVELEIVAETGPEVLVLEDPPDRSGRATGRVVATSPTFFGIFGAEAARAGLELRVSRLAVLFSDLVGSTALYDRVGDARAFELVQRHFAAAREVIEAHRGVVVKTIGDAVMATFDRAGQAVAAARDLVRRTRGELGTFGLGVRVGVHEGPMLVVAANGRLDFFGTTVNLAARFEGKARRDEVALDVAVFERPEVAEWARGHPVRRFDAQLKGVPRLRTLAAVNFGRSGSASPEP